MIDVMRFRLGAGADDKGFREADRRVQTEVAYLEPGLVRRTTARSGGGEWIVLEIWHSEDDADAASAHRSGHPTYAEFLAWIDASTVRTDRYTTLD
jgi:hypothetical protein